MKNAVMNANDLCGLFSKETATIIRGEKKFLKELDFLKEVLSSPAEKSHEEVTLSLTGRSNFPLEGFSEGCQTIARVYNAVFAVRDPGGFQKDCVQSWLKMYLEPAG